MNTSNVLGVPRQRVGDVEEQPGDDCLVVDLGLAAFEAGLVDAFCYDAAVPLRAGFDAVSVALGSVDRALLAGLSDDAHSGLSAQLKRLEEALTEIEAVAGVGA